MLVLSRRELYDLVWSMPVTKLAETFGVSDVGLAKICDRHRVPVPPRGYWARKEAGQKVKQAIFAEADDPLLDRIAIASARESLPEPVREIVDRRRAERKAAARAARPDVMAPPRTKSVDEPHSAVRATIVALRRAKPSASGVVLATGQDVYGISIGSASLERVIYILDCLARACETRGITISPEESRMSAAIDADSVSFQIQEKTKRVPHVLTAAAIAAEEKRRRRTEPWARGGGGWGDIDFAPGPPQFDTSRNGALGLEINGCGRGVRRSRRDGKTQVLETLVDDIVGGLEAHIVAGRSYREERERKEAECRELERRRGLAKARIERERSRKALLAKLITTERRAGQLREWIAATQTQLAENPDPDLRRMSSEPTAG